MAGGKKTNLNPQTKKIWKNNNLFYYKSIFESSNRILNSNLGIECRLILKIHLLFTIYIYREGERERERCVGDKDWVPIITNIAMEFSSLLRLAKPQGTSKSNTCP